MSAILETSELQRKQLVLWQRLHCGCWIRIQSCTPHGTLIGAPFWCRVMSTDGAFGTICLKDLGSTISIHRSPDNYALLAWCQEPHSNYGDVTAEQLDARAGVVDEKAIYVPYLEGR